MMKVLYIKFIIFYTISFAQLKITYEVKYKPDSTQSVYNIEEMALKIEGNTSYFYNETKFKLDSIYDRVTREYIKTGIALKVSSKYELRFGIIKDLKNYLFTEIQDLSSKTYSYPLKPPHLKWKLLSDIKKIDNYTVKKAKVYFGGRKWVAWYCEEIPMNDGPYKFYGLPGLILEIEDEQQNYQFKLLGISKNIEKNILPKNLIVTTEKKFSALKSKIIKDPAMFARESVMSMNNVIMKDTQGNNMKMNDLFEKINDEFYLFLKTHNNHIEKQKVWIR